jgi:hypothetical protein
MVRRQLEYNRNVSNYNIWYLTAVICDDSECVEFIDPSTLSPHSESESDWVPFKSQVQFEMAEFLFSRNQMPATQIDILLKLWEATLAKHGDAAPFSDHRDLYATIDSISFADTPWESFNVVHNDNKPDRDIPSWMTSNYDVWFRNPRTLLHNLISNPDFDKGFDYVPFREYDQLGNHRFQDFMSGNWAWKQAVWHFFFAYTGDILMLPKDLLAEDDHTHGSMFVPIILGSDKTTVSIATGNNEYWPIYMSIGNICNNIRRAHRNGVVLLGFFAIPKCMCFRFLK